ncbi:MOSC N-terminal beta barrel domain-containing protein [Geodermatophilus sp. YIM 151500]|uniref:MOSC domain-containing protein n=1 Tax=Geodermatophilus sp. YIM 151500 TaxID=2984531 RepID=UPI0021E492B2|nr:MOSC N-terminal beta barrel domain-containing protein [Geodermatophilus sp. YIM 151500]MCV2491221.1 MOSC N-terminal beta barrel domain-containing protein [Geodermatophilus sp. YIM 151500]
MSRALTVVELWRYPVKSLQGERLDAARLGAEGVQGDRQWALFDLDTGFGLTARRVPDLLFAAARTRPDGGVEVVLPDGTVAADDAALSAWTGRRVALRSVADAPGARRYENLDDATDEAGPWHPFDGAAGAFHDDPGTRVSLVSTGTTGGWHPRRFRSNVLLDGVGEDVLVGRRIGLGDAVLAVVTHIPRCVMVTRPQPGAVGRDTSVLKTIHRERGGTLAVGALVERPGTVRRGDEATVLD